MLVLVLTFLACGTDPGTDTTDPGTAAPTDTGSGDDPGDCQPAAEACNGVDDDCDGEVDEAGASGEMQWFADADADGFGDAGVSVFACAADSAHVADSTDCDDANSAVHPGSIEVGSDGDDNDCDPSTVVSMNLYDSFSSTANPFGAWSFGYARSADGAGSTTLGQYGEFDASVDYWQASGVEGVSVYRNHTSVVWTYSSAAYPAESLTLHPGAAGEFTVIQWTAPATTQCRVDVVFSANDSTTSVVAVYFGRTPLWEGEISGSGDEVAGEGSFLISAGDTLTFSVGMNGNYVYDSTGVAGTLACR